MSIPNISEEGSRSHRHSVRHGSWKCKKCTFENSNNNIKCNICGSLNSPNIYVEASKTWSCEECTYDNNEQITQCEMCGNMQSTHFEVDLNNLNNNQHDPNLSDNESIAISLSSPLKNKQN